MCEIEYSARNVIFCRDAILCRECRSAFSTQYETRYEINLLMRNRKRNHKENYDYNTPGLYFVTICTKDRQNFFGEIKNCKMVLSFIGELVERFWLEIPAHFVHVKIQNYIVMPNHIHGIIELCNFDYYIVNSGVDVNTNVNTDVGNADLHSLHPIHPLHPKNTKQLLSKIIHGFKSSVTRELNTKFQYNIFGWQKSFWDEIIKNKKHLYNIQNYIDNNINNEMV